MYSPLDNALVCLLCNRTANSGDYYEPQVCKWCHTDTFVDSDGLCSETCRKEYLYNLVHDRAVKERRNRVVS